MRHKGFIYGKRKTDIDNVQKLRRWQITINNPIDKGWTHEALKNVLQEMSVVYWCMADEQASTFHTHIYVVFKNQVRLETMCNKFKGGHFDVCEGNSRQNRDYVFKEGKWLDSEKELLISVIHMRNGVFYRKKVKADGRIWQSCMIS